MSISVDHTQASTILKFALQKAQQPGFSPTSKFSSEIREIVNGNHKTFRYILVTALLAKSIDARVHTLALQAGSSLTGAYDARSLCHDELVPFERKHLANAFGGSNEPFLNKPARFPELATKNAVRAGDDQRKLNSLCSFLPRIETKQEALEALTDAVYFATARSKALVELSNKELLRYPSRYEILDFLDAFIEQSLEGETCALAAGGVFSLLSPFHENFEVRVHPVNQCGASSKEVSDVDVYANAVLVYTCEVKDKPCSLEDVEHAVTKVAGAKFDSLLFVTGKFFAYKGWAPSEAITAAKKRGIFLTFFNVRQFAESVLSVTGNLCDKEKFFKSIVDSAIAGRFKDETVARVERLAKTFGWV